MIEEIKNIIVFTNTLEKGGAEMQSVELSKVLSERYKVWLVVFYGEKTHPELLVRLEGYDVELIRMSGRKCQVVCELMHLFKIHSIDCIYSFLATGNFYAGVLGKLCGIKYRIGGIRNSHYVGMKLIVQRMLHNRFMTRSIANNYSAIEPLVKAGFQKNKFEVIHNVFPKPNHFFERVESGSDELRIITVGRFVAQKDYETALRTIALLRTKQPTIPFKCVIIGYGELEEQVREWVEELNLSDVVEIKINPNNIFEHLVNADVYLSTSLFEGTSNSILEAMYAQLPVVATNVGDNAYMVTEENGYLTEVKDVEKLAESLSLLLQDEDMRLKMGHASREIVETRFSQEVFAKKNFELLERLQHEYH